MWKGEVTADGTGVTISGTRSGGGAHHWGWNATQWRDHGGVGNTSLDNSNSGISKALTCSDNSAITGQANDWNATDVASRTWMSINGTAITETLFYSNAGVSHTVLGGRASDVGAAGSKTWGLSSPAGPGYLAAIGLIEVLGLAATYVAGSALLTESGLVLVTEAGVPLVLS
jgi:hypothetical protein